MLRIGRWIASVAATAGLSVMATAVQAADMTVAGAAGAEHTPFFAAVEKGFFSQQGLDVEVKLFTSGVEMINALNAGDVQATVMGTYPLLGSVSKGLPVKLIAHNWGDALQVAQSDVLSIVGLTASGVHEGDVASLKGLRVGLPLGSGAEPYLIGLLGDAGLGKSDVEMINIAPSNLATALTNGDVDAISAWEAWPSNALTTVKGTVRVKSGDCASCYDSGTILSTDRLIETRRDDLERFLTAYAASQQWVRQNRAEAAEISARWIPGTSVDTLTEALQRIPFDMRISKNTLNGFEAVVLPLMLETGRIDKLFDPTTAIDASLVDAVQKSSPEFFSDLKPLPENLRY